MITTLAGCDDPFLQYMQSDQFIAVMAVTLGCLTGMIAIIAGMTAGVLRTRSREQTNRELAAYVAEGSLDPDQAVAMLNAARPKGNPCGADKMMGHKT